MTSPYRTPDAAALEAPAPPRARRVRWRIKGHRLALLGSLLGHAAVLIASAASPHSEAAAEAATEPGSDHAGGAFLFDPDPRDNTAAGAQTAMTPLSQYASGAFFVHADLWETGEDPYWPLPEGVEMCFDRTAIEATGRRASTVEAYGYEAGAPRSWERFDWPEDFVLPDEEPEYSPFHNDLRSCTRTAVAAGWSGKGQVFVRVTSERRSLLVQALPRDSEANHPGLLCCVRKSQVMLARYMSPGETVRYLLGADGDWITLVPAH